MEKLRYKDAARYYDLLFEWKDYKKDTERIASVIKKYKKSGGRELLEVACGTGNYLRYLHKGFSCTGLDLYGEMLAIAKKKVPDARYVKANMIDFKLKKRFDVILCLFADICYARTYPNLVRTIRNFSRHLKEGGVLIFDPWLDEPTYEVGKPTMNVYDGKDIKIAVLSVQNVKRGMGWQRMHFLVAERGRRVRHFTTTEVEGLFEKRRVLAIMKSAGFDARYIKRGLSPGLGLYLGIKK